MGTIRNTKSVMAILQQFEQVEHARSVVQLVEELRQKMNKTTVYRILERLEGGGQLHSFAGKDGNKWYAKCMGKDANGHSSSHPHFQCRSCGKTECLPIQTSIPSLPNHKIDTAELLLVGQCKDCLTLKD